MKAAAKLGAAVAFASIWSSPHLALAQTCTATVSAISYGSGADVLPGIAIDSTGTWSVSCTGTPNATVRICANLGRGTPVPNGTTSRRMRNAATATNINHDLYSDPARTQRWGTWGALGYAGGGLQIDIPLNGSGNGSTIRTIYARILANQKTARPGTYTMTLSGNSHTYSRQYAGATPCPTGSFVQYATSTVTTTIASLCYMTIVNIDFGSHSTLTSSVSAIGAINPQCSNTLPYTISLGGGLSGATNPTQRKMAQGAKQVTYGLYRNATFTQPWGSTVGVDTVARTGTGNNQSVPVYGRLPVQAIPGTGTYSDTVVVTVIY